MYKFIILVALIGSFSANASECSSAKTQFLKSAEQFRESLEVGEAYDIMDFRKDAYNFEFQVTKRLKEVCPVKPNYNEIETKCSDRFLSRFSRLLNKHSKYREYPSYKRDFEKEFNVEIELLRVELDENLCKAKAYI